jgi:hypothetical protein
MLLHAAGYDVPEVFLENSELESIPKEDVTNG